MATNKTLVSLAFMGTVVCIWSASFIFIKLALMEISPVTLAFARFAIASPILIGVVSCTRRLREEMKRALTKEFWVFAFLGLSGVTLLYVFQFYSLRFISATEGAIIINFHAIFAMFLSAAFLNESLTSRKLFGVLVAFSGLIVITLRDAAIMSLNSTGTIGVLLMVAAALCWATYSVVGKKVLHRHSNQVTTSCVFLLGTLFLFPFAMSEGGLRALVGSSWVAWISVVFLAIPCSVIVYVIWNWLIRVIDVTKVLVSLYVIPIPTAVLSYVVLGERITYPLVIGAALVIIGVYLTGSSGTSRAG